MKGTALSDHTFAGSHAILIGTSTYTAGFGSAAMPAAARSLDAMRTALQGPGGWPETRITQLLDESCAGPAYLRITELIHDTTGILIFYYVGHGLPLVGDDLGLAWTDTSEDQKLRLATSLRVSRLRREIQYNCDAGVKILILDCCSSGIATRYALGTGEAGARVQQAAALHGEGTYTWTACGDEDTFFESTPDGLTYFTKSLTRTMFDGIASKPAMLTVTDVHKEILRRYPHMPMPEATVKPEPLLEFRGTPPDAFPFARNLAFGASTESAVRDINSTVAEYDSFPPASQQPAESESESAEHVSRRRKWTFGTGSTVALAAMAIVVVLLAHPFRTDPATATVADSPGSQVELPFTGLKQPRGVAVAADGDVYVADTGNNRLLRLAVGSKTPVPLSFPDSAGSPEAVAVDTGGNLYVSANGAGGEILRYAKGAGEPTTLVTGLTAPMHGITVDPAGNIYILTGSDAGLGKVAAGTSNSTPVSGGLSLRHPSGVVVGATGDIYVSQPAAGVVSRLAAGSQEFVALTATGFTDGPDGLAVDSAGTVYAALTYRRELLRLTPESTVPVHISVVGQPTGIAAGADRRFLYYTDVTSNRVWRVPADG
ncbi:caspase, EACC1-associated type [Nocardia sp. BMG111209]|uniref:caspase, EACC1-associated type n=1 Tax=Nocardia sp. BMG111209 TaxID=1160137 RepID=UPI00035E3A75|nr:caspase family protein [Nocardia sp. BMG111209]